LFLFSQPLPSSTATTTNHPGRAEQEDYQPVKKTSYIYISAAWRNVQGMQGYRKEKQ